MQAITAREVFTTPLGAVSVCVSNGRVVEVGFVGEALPSFAASHADGTLARKAASQLGEYFAGKRKHLSSHSNFQVPNFKSKSGKKLPRFPLGRLQPTKT